MRILETFSPALAVVLATFVLPLVGLNLLNTWFGKGHTPPAVFWVLVFAFYFVSYFVIVFFNTALAACALKVIGGEEPTVGYGLSVAVQRLPQIAMWALLSAVVGVGLKAIENAHEKAGAFISAILGSAWSALTYLVVPVIAAEGVGPVDSVKRSFETIKETWGEALVGNGGVGIIGFLMMIPVVLVTFLLAIAANKVGGTPAVVVVVVLGVLAGMIVSAVNSAADTIFRAILYNFATGKTLPEGVEAGALQGAFSAKE
ncbi:MAG: DUF6159 family protein [Planctomycetota bacterium]|nr:DUF6159 family protein [Planctomycetota bacterium]